MGPEDASLVVDTSEFTVPGRWPSLSLIDRVLRNVADSSDVALDETFRTFKVRRDPECPACGPNAAPIVIAEYDEHCLPHAVLADGTQLSH